MLRDSYDTQCRAFSTGRPDVASHLQQRRARLRAEYGFDFPDDFHRFWEFAFRLSPLEPLRALEDVGIALVGPFEVLAGRFDGRVPRHSLLLHWRYYLDPPEFFTVLAGASDGLHWGYYLDDPDRGAGCLASYYARDAYEVETDGDTLFEAVRLHLEYIHRDNEEYAAEDPDNADAYLARLSEIARVRDRLMAHGTGERPMIGEEYTESFAGVSLRNERVVADTVEGMGVVVPPECYRPLSLADRKLWAELRRSKDPLALVEEGRAALRDGFPGTALKLAKELWATTGRRKQQYAAELLDAAYEALGRETLRRVLQTHLANRELESVDILEEEDG
jgi:hypothetical protein